MKLLFTSLSVFNHLLTGVHEYFYTTVLFRCFSFVVLRIAYTFYLFELIRFNTTRLKVIFYCICTVGRYFLIRFSTV